MNAVVREVLQTAAHEVQALPPHGEMRCILSKVLSLITVAYDEGYQDGYEKGYTAAEKGEPNDGGEA